MPASLHCRADLSESRLEVAMADSQKEWTSTLHDNPIDWHILPALQQYREMAADTR